MNVPDYLRVKMAELSDPDVSCLRTTLVLRRLICMSNDTAENLIMLKYIQLTIS